VNDAAPKRSGLWLWLPLGLFFGFFVLVMFGLFRPADREVASAFIGKPLPQFDLRPAVPERPGLKTADMAGGKPKLLNVFASWCIPCAAEAPQLAALAQQGVESTASRSATASKTSGDSSASTATPSLGSAPTMSARFSWRSAARACRKRS
jgi:hypothetical protein